MLSKYIEFCIDTHVILQFKKKKLIDFFNPKACLAISDVEGAILLLFLFFYQEDIFRLPHRVFAVDIVHCF